MNKIIENIDYSNISRLDISLTNNTHTHTHTQNENLKIFLEYTYCARSMQIWIFNIVLEILRLSFFVSTVYILQKFILLINLDDVKYID